MIVTDLRGNLSGWALSTAGLVVPEHCIDRPVAVDLFAGAGGFSLGFHQAGWHVIGAVELDHPAAVTYMVNLARPGVEIHFDSPDREAEFEQYLARHLGFDRASRRREKRGGVIEPGALAGSGWIASQSPTEPSCEHFWIADARNLRGDEMLGTLGLDEVDAVIGGPPCQGFSAAGKRNVCDPRNTLVFEFVRLATELRARTICMENVAAMASMVTTDGVPVVEALAEMLETGGFGTLASIRKALGGSTRARTFVRREGPAPKKMRSTKKGRAEEPQLGLTFDVPAEALP